MTKRIVRINKQVEVWVVVRHDMYDGRIFMDTTTISQDQSTSKTKAKSFDTNTPNYAKDNPVVGTAKASLVLDEDFDANSRLKL